MGHKGCLRHFVLVTIAFLLALLESTAYSADIDLSKPTRGSFGTVVKFTGQIKTGDCERLTTVLENAKQQRIVVSQIELKSIGGDVSESLCIGRLVRAKRLVTVGSSDQAAGLQEVCASACQFVWLAGIYRLGDVLVHRPYIPNDGNNIEYLQFEKFLSDNKSSVRSYFDDLAIPVAVLDFIFSVPSDQIAKLSEGNFNLVVDPIFLEYVIRSCGAEMSADDLRVLKFFEEVVASEPNLANETALKYMRQYRENWAGCARQIIAKVQKDAQLGVVP